MEQIDKLKNDLLLKEQEYQDTIHNIDKKVLQDKTQLKKEMLQKVNEAVTNFRNVADQQMAETTKRAIRENTAINAQLQKMSTKTVELISENEKLSEELQTIKTENWGLKESEKELAKRNIGHQKVIQMLVEKLRESDKLLEIAYDTGIIDQASAKLTQKKLVEYESRPTNQFTNYSSEQTIQLKEFIDRVAAFASDNLHWFKSDPLFPVWKELMDLLSTQTEINVDGQGYNNDNTNIQSIQIEEQNLQLGSTINFNGDLNEDPKIHVIPGSVGNINVSPRSNSMFLPIKSNPSIKSPQLDIRKSVQIKQFIKSANGNNSGDSSKSSLKTSVNLSMLA